MSFGPYSAFYLMFYEQLIGLHLNYYQSQSSETKKLQKGDLPTSSFMVSGALAGAIASFLTNPLDMAKLRIQVERAKAAAAAASPGASASAAGEGVFNYPNIFKGVSLIHQNEGWKGLFKGVGARIAFASPAAALTLTFYEEFKQFYLKMM
eukprot:TRINITY_DN29913_c0_g1_i3.p3 TRINITY_DN29913_c0_g1~~TRINITY_DN29913_c0_g1_i3.p3  ORF type:complete len:151 (+),score=46.58 TRINITY_DN29913_c0_g1_i3:681-1133(+)